MFYLAQEKYKVKSLNVTGVTRVTAAESTQDECDKKHKTSLFCGGDEPGGRSMTGSPGLPLLLQPHSCESHEAEDARGSVHDPLSESHNTG